MKILEKARDTDSIAAMGRRIRKRRIKLGLRQKDVAEQCGVTQANINQIESGNANPALRTCVRIARALGRRCRGSEPGRQRTLLSIRTRAASLRRSRVCTQLHQTGVGYDLVGI